FLARDPKERLGVKGGMDGIRQHPFFQAAAYETSPENWWRMLESKQMTPRFQPSSEQNNFDATYDLEELLLDDEPLTYRSTRKRAQRIQKEKNKALKEENARLKAEHEAAVAAAELAMQAMNVSADDYYSNNSNSFDKNRQQQQKKIVKKKSKLYMSEGKDSENNSNSSSTNSSYVHLSQPLVAPQYVQSPTQQHSHALSQQQQQGRQYQQQQQQQFQSPVLPAAGVDLSNGTGGNRGTASIPLASQFPMPPPPTASRQSGQHIRNHSAMYNQGRQHPASVSLPPPPTQGLPMNPPQQGQHYASSSYSSHSSKPSLDSQSSSISITAAAAAGNGMMHSGSTASGYTYSTTGPQRGGGNSGVTAIYLSKPVLPGGKGGNVTSSSFSPPGQFQQAQYQQTRGQRSYCDEDDQLGKSLPSTSQYHMKQHLQQQQQQQQQQNTSTSTSSSSSLGGGSPLPHPLPHRGTLPNGTTQRYGPNQQYQSPPPLQRHPSPNPPGGVTYPKPAADAISAPAAVPSNMSRKEKFAYQMALIDREFTTFDYTVYESYNGLVDPVTMSVGDPPEWVRNRDL
ncbi:hypothetical protein BGX26_010073, partial [Mortierella sp. AD094]